MGVIVALDVGYSPEADARHCGCRSRMAYLFQIESAVSNVTNKASQSTLIVTATSSMEGGTMSSQPFSRDHDLATEAVLGSKS